MKRILSMLLVLTLCMAMLPVAALAASTKTVYVSSTGSGTLNLRKGPGKSYAVIGYVHHGDKVTPTGTTSGEWSKITTSKGKTGWIKTMYFDGTTKELGTGWKNLKLTGSQTMALRKGPGSSYASKATLHAGDTVKVLYTEDGWAKVSVYASGKTGWIKISKIGSTASTGTDPETPPSSAKKVYRTTASVLNLRKGPGTSYGIKGKLSSGTPFTITKTSGNWYQIETFKGQTGWVSKNYTATKATLKVTASTLNVRKSYSKSSKILSTLKRGTWITVSKLVGNWAYMKSGSKKGYVYKSYLTN